MATSTLSNLASLIALMGHTHERVSKLEAATAKNKADVATTMAAHATTPAAVAGIGTTVTDTIDAAVAGIGMTVTNTVDDLVGRHIGSLKLDISSLGQDILTLRVLLATMQGTHHNGTIPPRSPPPTVPPLKDTQPAPVDTGPALEPAQPPVVNDTPPPAAAGAGPSASRLFPHVDSTNLRVDAAQNKHFHSHTGDQGFPPGGRHDKDVPLLTGTAGPRMAANLFSKRPHLVVTGKSIPSLSPLHPGRPPSRYPLGNNGIVAECCNRQ